jgi:putative sterol carrier protein
VVPAAAGAADVSAMPAPASRAELVALVTRATDEQLAAGLAANGDAILSGVFGRMSQNLDAEAAGDTNAVLEWQVATGPDEPPRRYQLVIAGGTCTLDTAAGHRADVVFTIGGVDFLRMVAGMADPGELFMFGRLQATGDLFLAAQSRAFFVPPEDEG